MRLSNAEQSAIIEATRMFDPEAELWLFGSRANTAKKGGDIDLAIRSDKIGLKQRMLIRRMITDSIGEQKIDIVVSRDGSDPFFRLALETGVRIDGKPHT